MPIVFLLVSLTIVLITFASPEDKTQVAPPKTELETFLGKTRHIIVKEFHLLGSVSDESGTGLNVSSVTLFEPGAESKKQA
jgi:hypothetical protein